LLIVASAGNGVKEPTASPHRVWQRRVLQPWQHLRVQASRRCTWRRLNPAAAKLTPPNSAPQNPLPRSRCKYLRNSLRQNLTRPAASWPHTSNPANTEPATINRNKQLQTTSNQKPSNQKPPNRKPPNQKPPNQKPPKVCHGWVDIKVGGEWAGRYSASFCHCFSLCQKESADMSADVVPTRHVMSSGMVQTTESDKMSGRHSRHFQDMSACRRTTCHLGGFRDM